MISLLKTFGKGLLYVIGAPFFVVALLLFGVIGLGAFIFQIIKSIIYFFTGQKFFPELAEDKKLRLMREPANDESETVQEDHHSNIISPIYEEIDEEPKSEPVFIQREQVSPTIEETVFEDTSSLEDILDNDEDDSSNELLQEDEEEGLIKEENHTILETNDVEEEKEDIFEDLETYIPRSSTYSDIDEDEESDTDSGVDINYDL